MKTPTYKEYLADPKIREQIERECRRARSEAIQQLIVMPVRALFRRSRRPTPSTRMQMRAA